MKIKFYLPALVFVFGFLTTKAQYPTFIKGDKVLNLGFGIGGYGSSGYKVTLPPLSASFDYGLKDNILDKGAVGIGVYVAFGSYKQSDYNNSSYWKYNKTVIGVRGTFHYPFVDRLDTYAGMMLGYKSESWRWNGVGTGGSKSEGKGPAFSLFVGGRYYITDNIAALAELGVGICVLNLGFAIKF